MSSYVVITGGTKGLGRALTLTFARAGFFVLSLYSSDEEAAKKLAVELSLVTSTFQVIRHDIRLALGEELKAILTGEDAHGLIIIHNACARFEPKPLHLTETTEFRENWEVAVQGALSMAQGTMRKLVQVKGTFVSVLSSSLEDTPPKGFSAYISSKCALMGLTRAMGAEYGPQGVRIFSVSPGYMRTDLTQHWNSHILGMIESNLGGIQSVDWTAEEIFKYTINTALPAVGENYLIPDDN